MPGGLDDVVSGLCGLRSEERNGGESPPVDQGIHVQQMVEDIFQDLDSFHDGLDTEEEMVPDMVPPIEDPIDEFEIGQDTPGQGWMCGSPLEIQEAMKSLYSGSKCSKLAFVIMFLNICGNHNVPNVFVSEMLAFLRTTVLP